MRHISNVPGWRTKRKILVLESDDWGSVRMPSLHALEYLKSSGVDVGQGGRKSYNYLDTLASPDDLSALFDILSKSVDKNGNSFVMTAISVVANPDFNKIKGNGFTKYFYEPFTTTLKNYYPENKSFELWKEGLSGGLFVPQFHGREHLNVAEWMRSLQSGDRDAHLAFEKGLWGYSRKSDSSSVSFQAAFDFYDKADLNVQAEAIKEGLSLFYDLFGYRSTFFVPPNGPFSRSLEKIAAENGILYLSTPKILKEPQGEGRNKKVFHRLGQRNKFGQYYMVRNCFFEPWQGQKNWVDSCLKEIEISYKWHKPAVISSHRVNYIGVHDIKNRDNSLFQLKRLLKSVQKRWPEVEFMTSQELGRVIANDND